MSICKCQFAEINPIKLKTIRKNTTTITIIVNTFLPNSVSFIISELSVIRFYTLTTLTSPAFLSSLVIHEPIPLRCSLLNFARTLQISTTGLLTTCPGFMARNVLVSSDICGFIILFLDIKQNVLGRIYSQYSSDTARNSLAVR